MMTTLSSAARFFGRTGLLALTLWVAACGDPVGVDEFEEARDRWEGLGIDDYALVLRPLCFCIFTGPAQVTVRDGEIVSVLDGETGEPIEGDLFGLLRTIDELFVLIEAARAEDAHTIRVEYDSEYGFPTDLWIDYSENIADEEIGYQLSEFTELD